MLLFRSGGARLCDGLPRREILHLGALGCGLSLAGLLQAEARSQTQSPATLSPAPRARSCIILFLTGGVPQHSSWDPKPDAPPEVRGAFGPIATSAPGVSICELWPRTARQMHHIALLRGVSTGDHAHSSSAYYMLTGRPHQPMNFENANPGAPNDAPCLGGILSALRPPQSALPAALRLPQQVANTDGSVWPGQDAGFLGRAADPWLLQGKPAPAGFALDQITLPDGLEPDRLDRRQSLRAALARRLDTLLEGTSELDPQYARAWDIIRSPAARAAFDLAQEPQAARDLYGDSPFGRSVLLARRLVEAGARLVQVNWYRGPDEPPMNPVWDSHLDETNRLKNVLVPPADQALSALIADLHQRGLLEETLVVCQSEFGRSPRLDAQGGRGHWGSVFSVALAGGGIRGGTVFGASDPIGGQPREGLVRPEDLLATLLHSLGIDPATELHDPLGRPWVASRGQIITPIL